MTAGHLLNGNLKIILAIVGLAASFLIGYVLPGAQEGGAIGAKVEAEAQHVSDLQSRVRSLEIEAAEGGRYTQEEADLDWKEADERFKETEERLSSIEGKIDTILQIVTAEYQ